MTTLSLTAVAAACAASLVAAKSHEDKAAVCKEDANKAIDQLHGAKAVVGDRRKCAMAASFYDGLVTGGLAKSTAANYLTVFRDAVKTGKPVKEWNPNRKGGKKGGAKTKGSKALADLFRPAFNHDSGKSFQVLCAEIEARYQNDEFGNMYDGFVDYLKAQGDEISE
ncbi:MAG: hypothetical protein EBU33_04800 [Sphingobacteriia bacterium]|nr:hypothetical protein [Sphingobacteriia bacterium]